MVLQSDPNIDPPFPKLFAKNLAFGRSFPVERYFLAPPLDDQLARHDMNGCSAGAAQYEWISFVVNSSKQ